MCVERERASIFAIQCPLRASRLYRLVSSDRIGFSSTSNYAGISAETTRPGALLYHVKVKLISPKSPNVLCLLDTIIKKKWIAQPQMISSLSWQCDKSMVRCAWCRECCVIAWKWKNACKSTRAWCVIGLFAVWDGVRSPSLFAWLRSPYNENGAG